jgi:hypothetical protein
MRDFGGERRSGRRFPIRMDFRYRLSRSGQGTTPVASGCVVDISRTGILFSPRLSYPEDGVMVLLIDWPARRDKAPPVRLSVLGTVVRSDDRGTAIRIMRHGFELGREEPMPPEAPEARAVVG